MSSPMANWAEVSLGEICVFKYGKSLPASSRVPGDFIVFGSNGPVGTHVSSVTEGPTIIIGRKGSFGEVSYSEYPCWPIDTTYFVDSTSTQVDLRWLFHRLQKLGLTSLNRAAAIPGLNREDAYQQKLLLPSLPEQRRIAEILDRADMLSEKRRKAIAVLDDLSRAIFLEMLAAPEAGPVVSLGDHLAFVTSGGRGWSKYYAATGSRFIRSLDVRMNEIDDGNAVYVSAPKNAEAKRTEVKVGDVLLTITGSLIGRVAAASLKDQGSYISQHVAIIRADPAKLISEFLAFYLSLPSGGQAQIARMQYGQTKPGLNFEQIRKLQVPMPDIALQREFVRRLAAFQALRAAHAAHLAELDALFASLQQRAFRGDLWNN